MKKVAVFCILTVLYVSLSTALAGSRSGYQIVLMSIENQPQNGVAQRFKDYFESASGSDVAECISGNGIDVEVFYQKKIPAGINEKNVQQAISGDRIALKKVKKSLMNYRDDLVLYGFDALLAYRIEGDKIQVFAISPIPGERTLVSDAVIDPSKIISNSTINKLLCNTLSRLPYAFGP